MAQPSTMADSPVSVHKPGTMAQAAIASTAPEGMLIAPIWKRIVALCLDAFLITLIVALVDSSSGYFYISLMSLNSLLTKDAPYVIAAWIMHITFYWLYFKYTGRYYGRSLGQRAMRIAIVHDDGSLLGISHWGRRAAHKIKYIITFIGVLLGLWDALMTSRHETKRSPVDLANHTVAAVDWALPATTRGGLR